ncbi:MAG TPA: 2-oxoglutarate dehydrogenase complex dihydrolipoyllysine-residue succinyltransferase [Pirellulales bacterium]|nr:2-oxoglutarate dehydrogenase complex dihydrolipoyllysine-residue succinyltransferase [Pirellulales bacterium]
MTIELKVPTVGESITEVQLGEWLKGEGQFVERDQPVVEIESDKATVELPAPSSGKVSKILKQKGQTAAVGEVIGYLEESAAPAGDESAAPKADGDTARRTSTEMASASTTKQSTATIKPAEGRRNVVRAEPAGAGDAGQPWVTPAARRLLAEHGLAARDLEATGRGGRLLEEDVQRHLERSKLGSPAAEVAIAEPTGVPMLRPSGGEDLEVVPMSPLRRRVAERLVQAQQTAALLTTFNEVDMSAVMAMRQKYRETFQEKHNVKLGFMSFFVKATIEALKRFPQLNAEIRGTDIVYHNRYDIGIAVGGGKGLVVPVLRGADRLSFAELEKTIGDFGQRAQRNKIAIDELQGGTFTISNGGVYGSLMSTPIVNPPQSGILGLHAIQDRPVARDGQVLVRPMMYLALTYDHRLVDGREAVLFLRHVKELIEEPSRILLEI